MKYNLRYASNPIDFKSYKTDRIRDEFLVGNIFETNEINLTYTMHDRFIVGGAMPVDKEVSLEPIEPLKAEYFLHRREMGIINVGGIGLVRVGQKEYKVNNKDALYLGIGDKHVTFSSENPLNPALFYINSTPAHKFYPDKLIPLVNAIKVELGSPDTANARTINKIIVAQVLETCQLQMGMTILKPGSVWNTMPPHVHSRRMEVYFYFDVPQGHAICHFMGQPDETRCLWAGNREAVISPPWSIHAAAGTSSYIFIWGMAGENIDYSDMDIASIDQIR